MNSRSSQDVHVRDEFSSPEDVTMDDGQDSPSQPNDHIDNVDMQSPAATPASLPAGSSSTAVESIHTRMSPNDDDSQPPPTKRARKYSDADQASAHVSSFYFVRPHRRTNLAFVPGSLSKDACRPFSVYVLEGCQWFSACSFTQRCPA